jgi:hypothetical protein
VSLIWGGLQQGIGLPYVVPKALTALEIDCLLEAEHYRGDLLSVVLQIKQEFWLTNPILNNELVDIRIQLDQIIQTASEEIAPLFGTFKYR